DHRLVDIYKRGPLYTSQVLLAAESFGDLLSRYKYLYLVSRQDRLLANDMFKLQRRIARERQTLVDARDALGRRRSERTEELQRYLARERAGARHRGWHREPRRVARDLPHVGAARSRRRVLQLLRVPERGHGHQGRARLQRPGHRARRRGVERPGAAPPLRDARARRDRPGSGQLAEGAPVRHRGDSVPRRHDARFHELVRSPSCNVASWRRVALSLTVVTGCGNRTDALRVSGTVEIRQVQLAPLTSGRLTRLLKDEGDTVRRGDTVAVLEQPGLDALIRQRRAQAPAAGLRVNEVSAAVADSARAANNLARAEPLRDRGIVTAPQDDELNATAA